jgi:hypothetical protein
MGNSCFWTIRDPDMACQAGLSKTNRGGIRAQV